MVRLIVPARGSVNLQEIKMLFLTNELAKKAEINNLSARDTSRPGYHTGASRAQGIVRMGL